MVEHTLLVLITAIPRKNSLKYSSFMHFYALSRNMNGFISYWEPGRLSKPQTLNFVE